MNYPVNVVVDHYGVEILPVQYISIHIGTCVRVCVCMCECVSLFLHSHYCAYTTFKTDNYFTCRALWAPINRPTITYIRHTCILNNALHYHDLLEHSHCITLCCLYMQLLWLWSTTTHTFSHAVSTNPRHPSMASHTLAWACAYARYLPSIIHHRCMLTFLQSWWRWSHNIRQYHIFSTVAIPRRQVHNIMHRVKWCKVTTSHAILLCVWIVELW